MLDERTQVLLAALRARGVHRIRRIRFKRNRTRLLSVSRDGATLHLDEAFDAAPMVVVDAIAALLSARRGSPAYRAAVAVLREWGGPRQAVRHVGGAGNGNGGAPAASGRGVGQGARAAAPDTSPAPVTPRPSACCATPAQRHFLREAYRRLNEELFGGQLPAEVPLRLSRRMTRRLGHVRYYRRVDGVREVIEIALNPDLMLKGNEAELRATLLHEMAHVEAWLVHGDHGHGAAWKRIARRVGCEPRACTRAPVLRRRPGAAPPTRVPALPA